MKKQLSKVILLMTVLLLAGVSDVCAKKKTLKISVVPSDAQISVDGNYVGDGVVEVTLDKSDFIAIKLEKEGYIKIIYLLIILYKYRKKKYCYSLKEKN